MPQINSGNERDVRIRPGAAPIYGPDGNLADQNLLQPIPGPGPGVPGSNPPGTQTEIPPTPGVGVGVATPSAVVMATYDWTDASVVCPRGFDMRTIDQFIFKFLVNHFASPEHIYSSMLKTLIYDPNPAFTHIRIASATDLDLPASLIIPALLYKRGEQNAERIVMGDMGERVEHAFVRRVRGTHTINCLAANAEQANELAQELFDAFTCAVPTIMSYLPFGDFQCSGVGPTNVSDLLQSGSQFSAMVGLSYGYEYGWTMRYLTPQSTQGSVIDTVDITITGSTDTNG